MTPLERANFADSANVQFFTRLNTQKITSNSPKRVFGDRFLGKHHSLKTPPPEGGVFGEFMGRVSREFVSGETNVQFFADSSKRGSK